MIEDNDGLADAGSRNWDVIVVGAGMGGASASWYLSEQGLDVLLCEMGRNEVFPDPTANPTEPEPRLNIGYWPTRLRTRINGDLVDAWPMMGCGVGGSSVHYGATLQRFEPSDFCMPQSPWPLSYAELEPYYRIAEALFKVHGATDPLSDISPNSYELKNPLPMSSFDRNLHDTFRSTGLHPYRLHVAIDPRKNCNLCGGSNRCNLKCMLDARRACIEPALRNGHLTVLDQTEVLNVEFKGTRACGVRARRDGAESSLCAQYVVVAAGAVFTPMLLLKSNGGEFPLGPGISSDLVGRNLMFHASDFIAIWPSRRSSMDGFQKSLALRDFYEVDGIKYGEIQSMGFPTSPGDILQYFHNRFWRSPFRHLPVLRHVLRIPASVASLLFREAAVYSTIVQDFPYPDNRVVPDESAPSGVCIEYDVSDELKQRVDRLRTMFIERLDGLRHFTLNQELSLNLGHPCGTCRAGSDPEDGVVDASFKVFGTENLFIADGSVLRSSGGTNPSLTIAACALKCADAVKRDHRTNQLQLEARNGAN